MHRQVALSTFALAALLLVSPTSAAAQSAPTPPPAAQEDEHATGWKELDEFHATMSASWHPAKGTNNLAPARQQADTLFARARAWMASPVPAKCDTPEIRSAMRDVLAHSERVARLVADRAVDAVLKQALKEAHDRFHVVEEHCHP